MARASENVEFVRLQILSGLELTSFHAPGLRGPARLRCVAADRLQRPELAGSSALSSRSLCVASPYQWLLIRVANADAFLGPRLDLELRPRGDGHPLRSADSMKVAGSFSTS